MSLKSKPQPTELDHIRDTVTGMVEIVGETRQDVKQVKEHQREHDKRFDEHDRRFDQQDKDNAEIKEMLKALLSR